MKRESTAAYDLASYPSTNVYSIQTGMPSLTRDPPWMEKVYDRLEELLRLEIGWDGYAGLPVSLANAIFALRVLESTCSDSTPMPQIVPGATGDAQIEWHLPAGEIELHVVAPNDVRAWRATGLGGKPEELQLANEFSAIASWLRELTEASVAANAAAA